MDNSFIQMLSSNAVAQATGNKVTALASELMKERPKDAAAAAKEFESMFVAQMLRQMFNEVPVDDVFGGGHAEETWRGLLIDEYGKVVSKAGGIGVADQVQKELLKLQGV